MAQQHVVASFRRRRNTIQQVYREAYLGNEAGRVDVKGLDGFVHIRYPGGVDANGYATFKPSTIVRCGIGAAFLPNAGATVVIGNDADGFDCVITGAWAQTIQAGITPAITNPLRREARFFTTDGYIPLKSYPVATGNTNSTKVTVREWIYVDDNGDYHRYQGTQLEEDKVELASAIAPYGYHCYAVVWHDTWLEAHGEISEVITISAMQAISSAVDDTDLEECFDQAPADSVPIEAYYLANGQTTIRQVARHIDLRQLINTPRLVGNPNPVTKKMRVWEGRQVVYYGSVIATTGSAIAWGRGFAIGDLNRAVSIDGGSSTVILGNPNPIADTLVLPVGRNLLYSGEGVKVTGAFKVLGYGKVM